MTAIKRAVLKTTLDELIEAIKDFNHFTETADKAGILNTCAERELSDKVCEREFEIARDLQAQSGVSWLLFSELADEIIKSGQSRFVLYAVLRQLGVGIAREKWYFEGEIHFNKRTGGYSIINGKEIYKLFAGDEITVKIKNKYWATSVFGYNKRDKGELLGWKGYKLEGLPARINLKNAEVEE